MNFNLDWDEPDIWSTEPSSTTTTSTSSSLEIQTTNINSEQDQSNHQPTSPTNQSDTSDSTTIPSNQNHLTLTLSQPTPTDSESSSSLNHQPILSIKTESIPKPFNSIHTNHQSSPNSPSILFSSPSDASSTQSMFSATADPDQSQSQSQSQSQISILQSQSNHLIDDDDFGDFDDGDELGQGLGTDDFGDFDRFPSLSPIPRYEMKSIIIPFKLPDLKNLESLKQSLTPAIDGLFINHQIDSSPWTTIDPIIKIDHQIQKDSSIPLILINQSDLLLKTWDDLIKNENGLGVPIDWKRSQIRRHFLVTLGIPVDLNDFLTPADLPKQKLSLDTISSNLLHPYTTPTPKPISSPTPSLTLDRKRCDELLSLNNEDLQSLTDEDLIKIRDELKTFNTTISDLLSQTLTKRDKLSQDSDSYNTMISDLITAAQRIKMGTPNNVNKRSSSIQLGSSSITSTAASAANGGSSRWFGSSTRSGTPTNLQNQNQKKMSNSMELGSKRSSVL